MSGRIILERAELTALAILLGVMVGTALLGVLLFTGACALGRLLAKGRR